MTERPLNAETPNTALRSWITDNDVFFKRNQGQIPQSTVNLADWRLSVEGLVKKELMLTLLIILRHCNHYPTDQIGHQKNSCQTATPQSNEPDP